MTQLAELARRIRRKNAAPFELTFDIMFEDVVNSQRVKNSRALAREAVAQQRTLPLNDVQFFLLRSCACDHSVDSASVFFRTSHVTRMAIELK